MEGLKDGSWSTHLTICPHLPSRRGWGGHACMSPHLQMFSAARSAAPAQVQSGTWRMCSGGWQAARAVGQPAAPTCSMAHLQPLEEDGVHLVKLRSGGGRGRGATPILSRPIAILKRCRRCKKPAIVRASFMRLTCVDDGFNSDPVSVTGEPCLDLSTSHFYLVTDPGSALCPECRGD